VETLRQHRNDIPPVLAVLQLVDQLGWQFGDSQVCATEGPCHRCQRVRVTSQSDRTANRIDVAIGTESEARD
jgi:hypothetical protein